MKISDIDCLRGDAPKTTHLARYDRANDRGAKRVLYVACPDCGSLPFTLCIGIVVKLHPN